jgi:RNase adapter protein RapZ
MGLKMSSLTSSVKIISFGFKYGPPSCNFSFDVSFLKNPARNEGKSLGSLVDDEMKKFVMSQPLTSEIIDCILSTIRTVSKSGDRMKVAIGCNGGLHRSQIIADQVFKILASEGYDVELMHRELGAS